jgi:hypothetical protein
MQFDMLERFVWVVLSNDGAALTRAGSPSRRATHQDRDLSRRGDLARRPGPLPGTPWPGRPRLPELQPLNAYFVHHFLESDVRAERCQQRIAGGEEGWCRTWGRHRALLLSRLRPVQHHCSAQRFRRPWRGPGTRRRWSLDQFASLQLPLNGTAIAGPYGPGHRRRDDSACVVRVRSE